MPRLRINLTFPLALLTDLDRARGTVPRSTFIVEIVRRWLAGEVRK